METEEKPPKENFCNKLNHFLGRYQFNDFSLVCTCLFLIFSIMTAIISFISFIVIGIYRTKDNTYKNGYIHTKMYTW